MTLTEKSDICDICEYDPCFCGGEPENCMRMLDADADNIRDLLNAAEFREMLIDYGGGEHDV